MNIEMNNFKSIDKYIVARKADNGGYSFDVYYCHGEFIAIPNHSYARVLRGQGIGNTPQELKSFLMEDAEDFCWSEYDVDSIVSIIFMG